jgi:hypothetical protein
MKKFNFLFFLIFVLASWRAAAQDVPLPEDELSPNVILNPEKTETPTEAQAVVEESAPDAPNYHLVGWMNTFIPGAGEAMQGNYGAGAFQAGVEVGTFWAGYAISKKSPLTLDGVPEEIPSPHSAQLTRGANRCTQRSGHTVCRYVAPHIRNKDANPAPQDITKFLIADILQEFGMKYHMVNVYNSYRKASRGKDGRIDTTSTKDLFLAPFKWEILRDPWVYGALGVSGLAVALNYMATQSSAIPQLTGASNTLYALNYTTIFPLGSGAPEEMFYRGFIQNELYHAVPSPYFSIPVTSLLYGFSHSSADVLSATVTGAYEGFVTHKDNGRLSSAIAYHFWADVMAGIMATALLNKNEAHAQFNFSFKY